MLGSFTVLKGWGPPAALTWVRKRDGDEAGSRLCLGSGVCLVAPGLFYFQPLVTLGGTEAALCSEVSIFLLGVLL